LFLIPDLSWFGYLVGPRFGAWVYNLAHSAPPLLAAGAGWHLGVLTVAGAVGLFRIGLHRVLNYGLKYGHSLAVTHLGVHGKRGPSRQSGEDVERHVGIISDQLGSLGRPG
jgi:hypothetical protein